MTLKIVYWVSTAILCLLYLGGAAFYLTQPDMVGPLLTGMGWPIYLVTLLPIVKILGPVAVLVRRPIWLSDLAYAGMLYHLIWAIIAHLYAGDGGFAPALVGLIAMLVSFFTQNAVRKGQSPYAGTRWGVA